MERSISAATIAEIEEALSQVSEIKAARVVASSEGYIEEIHVLALPTKSPKQLVRDIESTIMATFGIPVDHKKISIAQLGQDAVPKTSPYDHPRALIRSVSTETAGLEVKVSVALEIGGELFIGTATGPASQTTRQRLVAQAALNAVEEYLQGSMAFALEDVAIVRLGQQTVAVACIALVTSLGEQPLTGAALVRQSEKDSIVKATLDALNRRLGFLTTT
ncbi:hypothetical protein MX659_04220 [Coriobacteriia bacterium Es71-Z0120]|uniref:hypothetical protein n=1 Tax=Parvivirga hydrogeniphila TaxID=2939460 RepID=UPI002260DCC4|nr:hypothetical protein [Parvivirga hydrogeniphila]MCL4078805.1 hypothetical protein [Parvivirga hydrogeniphila]